MPHAFLLKHSAKPSFTCCCILKVWFLLHQAGQKRFFWPCNTFHCGEWKHNHKKSRIENWSEGNLLCSRTFVSSVNKCDSRARQSSFLDRVCLKEEWIFSVLKSKRPSVTSWCCFQRFFACAVLSVAVFIHCSLCELKCWGSSWHASSSASFWSEYLVAIGTKSKGHTPFK